MRMMIRKLSLLKKPALSIRVEEEQMCSLDGVVNVFY